jgi:hypothetical protein
VNAPRPACAIARRPAQLIATIVGPVFLLVGILGLVPGLTTDHDQPDSATGARR